MSTIGSIQNQPAVAETTFCGSCLQSLYDIVNKVREVVLAILQTICPCFCSSATLDANTVTQLNTGNTNQTPPTPVQAVQQAGVQLAQQPVGSAEGTVTQLPSTPSGGQSVPLQHEFPPAEPHSPLAQHRGDEQPPVEHAGGQLAAEQPVDGDNAAALEEHPVEGHDAEAPVDAEPLFVGGAGAPVGGDNMFAAPPAAGVDGTSLSDRMANIGGWLLPGMAGGGPAVAMAAAAAAQASAARDEDWQDGAEGNPVPLEPIWNPNGGSGNQTFAELGDPSQGVSFQLAFTPLSASWLPSLASMSSSAAASEVSLLPVPSAADAHNAKASAGDDQEWLVSSPPASATVLPSSRRDTLYETLPDDSRMALPAPMASSNGGDASSFAAALPADFFATAAPPAAASASASSVTAYPPLTDGAGALFKRVGMLKQQLNAIAAGKLTAAEMRALREKEKASAAGLPATVVSQEVGFDDDDEKFNAPASVASPEQAVVIRGSKGRDGFFAACTKAIDWFQDNEDDSDEVNGMQAILSTGRKYETRLSEINPPISPLAFVAAEITLEKIDGVYSRDQWSDELFKIFEEGNKPLIVVLTKEDFSDSYGIYINQDKDGVNCQLFSPNGIAFCDNYDSARSLKQALYHGGTKYSAYKLTGVLEEQT